MTRSDISRLRNKFRRWKRHQAGTVKDHAHIVWLSLGKAVAILKAEGSVPEFLSKQIDVNMRQLARVR
jgi:hypothetical protein